MIIDPVENILQPAGMRAPELNALTPNRDNYTTFLMQPKGDIAASEDRVGNYDQALAYKQFDSFLADATDVQADLVATPEYSMPWKVLVDSINAGRGPSKGKIWVLGCESISYNELVKTKAEIAQNASLLFEPIDTESHGFLSPLAYVFLAPITGDTTESKLVILCQFKTEPMGDKDHFEVSNLIRGSRIYQFGGFDGQEIKLISLICADVFGFCEATARRVYDKCLLIHIQLNPNPRQEQFRSYRTKLLQYSGDATEVVCLNWADKVRLHVHDKTLDWKNIAGSAWYLKPDKFDNRDETLISNHKLGLYYTWSTTLHTHVLFFNYMSATYLLEATKVAHVGVPASISRRRGPQLRETRTWDPETTSWVRQDQVSDNFENILKDAGGAGEDLKKLSDKSPFSAERVLALCTGKISQQQDWHKLHKLDSCTIDSSEVIFRLTFCQDHEQSACDFRSSRLIRCERLWNILSNEISRPASIEDFKEGFTLDWNIESPHQNARSNAGKWATVVYLGEDVNIARVSDVKKTLAENLNRACSDPDTSLANRQRLVVWYRNHESKIISHEPYEHTQIDKTGNLSEFDIGREE